MGEEKKRGGERERGRRERERTIQSQTYLIILASLEDPKEKPCMNLRDDRKDRMEPQ